jgi:hypothetical protein
MLGFNPMLVKELSERNCTSKRKREYHCRKQPDWHGPKMIDPLFEHPAQRDVDQENKSNYGEDWQSNSANDRRPTRGRRRPIDPFELFNGSAAFRNYGRARILRKASALPACSLQSLHAITPANAIIL